MNSPLCIHVRAVARDESTSSLVPPTALVPSILEVRVLRVSRLVRWSAVKDNIQAASAVATTVTHRHHPIYVSAACNSIPPSHPWRVPTPLDPIV